MITLVCGRQGSGKTLLLVKEAYKAWKDGAQVYSNVALNFPYRPLSYKDILDCKLNNSIIIIDEIHQLLPSRRSMKKTSVKIVDSFISQLRKQNIHLYCTTQLSHKVDVRIRDEADIYIECEKYMMINKELVPVLHCQLLDVGVPIVIKMSIKDMFSLKTGTLFFEANEWFCQYDTNEIIKVEGLE